MVNTHILVGWAEKNIVLQLLHEMVAEDIFSGSGPKYSAHRLTRRDHFICRILATRPKAIQQSWYWIRKATKTLMTAYSQKCDGWLFGECCENYHLRRSIGLIVFTVLFYLYTASLFKNRPFKRPYLCGTDCVLGHFCVMQHPIWRQPL
jgi:hypothetical protein